MSEAPTPQIPTATPDQVVAPHAAIVDRVIRVSAVVLRDRAGRVLNVRKHGTQAFMLPGGKPEPGESAAHCAAREVAEELAIELQPATLSLLGVFRTAAANEPGFALEATVFTHEFVEAALGAAPLAEIAEVAWLDPADPGAGLAPHIAVAPLNTEFVFPALLSA